MGGQGESLCICQERRKYCQQRMVYIRVSSRDQNEDRQLAAMKIWVEYENIYMDKQSGKDFNRPQYKKLIRRLKKRRLALY